MPAPQPPTPLPPDPPGSFLFDDDELAKITDEQRRHNRYTLANLPERKEQSILALLKERWPYREIARTLSVAFETVQAVAVRHAKLLDEHWKDFSRHTRRVGVYMVDRLEKNIDSIPVPLLPQAIKAIIECGELAAGRATSRVEHVGEIRIVDSVAEYERLIAPIEERTARRIAGKVIEPGQEMQLMAGKKTPPAPTPAPSSAPPGSGPACDCESRVSPAVPQANEDPATPFCHTLDPDQAQPGPPGGGVEPVGEGAQPWRHPDT